MAETFNPAALGYEEVGDAFDPASLGYEEVPQAQSSTSQPIGDILRRVPADAARAGLNALAMAGRIAPPNVLGEWIAEKVHGVTKEEALREVEGAAARSQDEYGVDPKYNNTVASAVASGFGQVLTTIASGPMAPIQAALTAGEQGYQEATEYGATGAKLAAATGINAGTAFVTEKLLGIPKVMGLIKANKNVPFSLWKTALKTAGMEGTQEIAEEIIQDLAAKGLYDPNRKLFDVEKLAKVGLVGILVGGPVGATFQAAENLSKENPQTIAPRQEMQDVAQAVDESLAKLATEIPQFNPQDLGYEEVSSEPAVTEANVGAPVVSPERAQKKSQEFIGTAVNTPSGVVTGEQVGSAHPTMIGQALDQGAPFETIEENLGFAFRKPDGTIDWVDRVEAGRRLTESGQIQGLKEGERLTSEHIRGEVPGVTFNPEGKPNAEQAAIALQPSFEQAVEAARAAGAPDPESAASQAQIELSEKGQLDPALFITAARRRGLDQARKSKETQPIDESTSPVVERGPMSEAASKEDFESLDQAVEALPVEQRNIIRTLEEEPDLTDREVGERLGMTVDQVKKAKVQYRKTMLDFIQKQGIGARLGPGAANIEEALAVYELRRFGQRFQESEEIDPEIRRQTGDRYYEPIPNRVTAQKATELIAQRGEESIQQEITDLSNQMSFADRVTVGQILIKRFNEAYKSLADKTSEAGRAILDKAVEVTEKVGEIGTRLGQGVQAFAMWNNLTAEGKLLRYQRKTKKAQDDYTRNNRTDIDQIKDIVNGEGTSHEKVRKIKKLKTKTARKVKSRAGKLVQKSKEGNLTDKDFYDLTADQLGLPVFTPEIASKILDLANKIDEAAEGMPKMEATLELNKFLAQQTGYDPGDLFWGYYYGNILSGTGTQMVNLVDTSLNVLNESVTLAIQNPRAAARIFSALAKGAASGRYDALMALTKGRRISDGKFVEDPFFMEIAEFGKKGGVPLKTDTAFRRTLKRAAESKLATPLNAWKYVGRVMSGADALAFRAAQEAKAAQLADRLSQGENIDSILGYDRLPEFRQQAESEGYTGAQAEARATELMLMSRPEEIQKASTDFASESTYNVKPYGIIGTVSNSIESAARKIPPLKLIVPFTRIVGNVLNRNLNNTPYGYYRAIRGKSGTKRDMSTYKEYTLEERQALLVRATVSTALLTAMGALHALGYIEISGGGPADPEKKKQLRATGWKPYTIRIGDRYFNYAYLPASLGISVLGNWLDMSKYKDFGTMEATDRLIYSLQAIAGSLMNQSFLTNLGTFWEAFGKNQDSAFAAMKRLTANTASALVPASSLLKDIEEATGSNVPKSKSFKEATISQIPFASQYLKPQLNAFGREIKVDRSRFETQRTSDPAWKVVIDKDLRVPVPNTFFDDPSIQYEYVREQGQAIEKWVLANESRLRNMDNKNAQDALENASDSIRKRVRSKYLSSGNKRKKAS